MDAPVCLPADARLPALPGRGELFLRPVFGRGTPSLVQVLAAAPRPAEPDRLPVLVIARADAGRSGLDLDTLLKAAVTTVDAGLADSIALCTGVTELLVHAHRQAGVRTLVTRLSLLNRSAEAELLPAARALSIRPVFVGPLAGGLLAGHGRHAAGPELAARLARLATFATHRHIGAARLAIAWLLARYPEALVLPMTRQITHAELNMAGEDIRLDGGDLKVLNDIFPVGDRYRPPGRGDVIRSN